MDKILQGPSVLGVDAEPLRANSYCVGGVDIREERVKLDLKMRSAWVALEVFLPSSPLLLV